MNMIKNMIKNEQYDDMAKWMDKAHSLHDIL